MSEIRISAGSWEAGTGSYEAGLLRLPNGDVRGVEDLVDLSVAAPPDTRRRAGIAGGLRSALTAVGPLPRPLDLAASVVGFGLGLVGGGGATSLQARFSDDATAVIVTDPATAALIVRDREVVRLAAARLAATPPAPALLPAPALALPAPERPQRDADRALTSIFEYEKRKGRLRRLAVAREPDET